MTPTDLKESGLDKKDTMLPTHPGIAGERTANSRMELDAQQSNDAINLLDLLITLAERKTWIVKTTLAVTALATFVVCLLPNQYTATTRILPPQQNQSSLASALTGQLAAMGSLASMAGQNLGLKNPNDLYAGMLKSRTVEQAIVQQFDLKKVYRDRRMSDACRDLEKRSSIKVGKEGFITISVDDRDRRRAADMANSYVTELRKLMQNVAVTEAGQRRLFYEQQMKQASDNLAEAEQAFKDTQQKTGVLQLEGQARAIIDSVVKLRAQIAAKEIQVQAMRF